MALGGTNDKKGIKFLKEALQDLGQRNKNFHAVVFGQYEPKETKYWNAINLYWGIGDDQSLAMLYSAADVGCAIFNGTLPQSATEAQSCGTPVVAFNCWLVDVVENYSTGYLAKPFQADDLSRGIDWVLKSKDYENIEFRSRKRAENLWSEKIITSKYERIYQKVLNSSPYY